MNMNNFTRMVQEIMEAQRRWHDQAAQMARMSDPDHCLGVAATATLRAIQQAAEEARRVESIRSDAIQVMIRQASEKALAIQHVVEQVTEKSLAIQQTMEQARRIGAIQSEATASAIASQFQRRVADEIAREARTLRHFTWVAEVQKQWAIQADTYLSRVHAHTIEVTSSGDIVVGRETVTSEEVARNLARLNKQLDSASTPVDYFRRLFSFLKRVSPALASVLVYFLLPLVTAILANLSTPIVERWWKEFAGRSREEVSAKVRENALRKYDPSLLRDHRFVTATRLRVRAGPGKEQRVRDELPRGKVVRVISTRHNWAQVEYFDEESEKACRGWVSSSHLGIFTE